VARATPYTRALGAAATGLLTRWLPRRAAGDTSASVLSGLADAATLTAVTFHLGGAGVDHCICHVLGGTLGIPHASANAAVLPYALAANEPYPREVQKDLAAVMRIELERHGVAFGPSLAERVRELQTLIGQPATLRELGVPQDHARTPRRRDLRTRTRTGRQPPPGRPGPAVADPDRRMARRSGSGGPMTGPESTVADPWPTTVTAQGLARIREGRLKAVH
jgi:alcohol dehydrogenase class IV